MDKKLITHKVTGEEKRDKLLEELRQGWKDLFGDIKDPELFYKIKKDIVGDHEFKNLFTGWISAYRIDLRLDEIKSDRSVYLESDLIRDTKLNEEYKIPIFYFPNKEGRDMFYDMFEDIIEELRIYYYNNSKVNRKMLLKEVYKVSSPFINIPPSISDIL